MVLDKSIYEPCSVISLNWVDMRSGFGYSKVIRHLLIDYLCNKNNKSYNRFSK